MAAESLPEKENMHLQTYDKSSSIVLRIRPSSDTGTGAQGPLLAVQGSRLSLPEEGREYSFDYIQDERSNPEGASLEAQETLFGEVVAPLCEGNLRGFSSTLLVSGAEGSGKTFTVVGEAGKAVGMVECAADFIFSRLEDSRHLFLSVFELDDQDRLRDLLRPSSLRNTSTTYGNDPLMVLEHPTLGAFVPGLSSAPCGTLEDVQDLIAGALRETALDATSLADRSLSQRFFLLELRPPRGGRRVTSLSTGDIMHLTPSVAGDAAGGTSVCPSSVSSTLTIAELNGIGQGLCREVFSSTQTEAPCLSASLECLRRAVRLLGDRHRNSDGRRDLLFETSPLLRLLRQPLMGSAKLSLITTVQGSQSTWQGTQRALNFSATVAAAQANRGVQSVSVASATTMGAATSTSTSCLKKGPTNSEALASLQDHVRQLRQQLAAGTQSTFGSDVLRLWELACRELEGSNEDCMAGLLSCLEDSQAKLGLQLEEESQHQQQPSLKCLHLDPMLSGRLSFPLTEVPQLLGSGETCSIRPRGYCLPAAGVCHVCIGPRGPRTSNLGPGAQSHALESEQDVVVWISVLPSDGSAAHRCFLNGRPLPELPPSTTTATTTKTSPSSMWSGCAMDGDRLLIGVTRGFQVSIPQHRKQGDGSAGKLWTVEACLQELPAEASLSFGALSLYVEDLREKLTKEALEELLAILKGLCFGVDEANDLTRVARPDLSVRFDIDFLWDMFRKPTDALVVRLLVPHGNTNSNSNGSGKNSSNNNNTDKSSAATVAADDPELLNVTCEAEMRILAFWTCEKFKERLQEMREVCRHLLRTPNSEPKGDDFFGKNPILDPWRDLPLSEVRSSLRRRGAEEAQERYLASTTLPLMSKGSAMEAVQAAVGAAVKSVASVVSGSGPASLSGPPENFHAATGTNNNHNNNHNTNNSNNSNITNGSAAAPTLATTSSSGGAATAAGKPRGARPDSAERKPGHQRFTPARYRPGGGSNQIHPAAAASHNNNSSNSNNSNSNTSNNNTNNTNINGGTGGRRLANSSYSATQLPRGPLGADSGGGPSPPARGGQGAKEASPEDIDRLRRETQRQSNEIKRLRSELQRSALERSVQTELIDGLKSQLADKEELVSTLRVLARSTGALREGGGGSNMMNSTSSRSQLQGGEGPQERSPRSPRSPLQKRPTGKMRTQDSMDEPSRSVSNSNSNIPPEGCSTAVSSSAYTGQLLSDALGSTSPAQLGPLPKRSIGHGQGHGPLEVSPMPPVPPIPALPNGHSQDSERHIQEAANSKSADTCIPGQGQVTRVTVCSSPSDTRLQSPTTSRPDNRLTATHSPRAYLGLRGSHPKLALSPRMLVQGSPVPNDQTMTGSSTNLSSLHPSTGSQAIPSASRSNLATSPVPDTPGRSSPIPIQVRNGLSISLSALPSNSRASGGSAAGSRGGAGGSSIVIGGLHTSSGVSTLGAAPAAGGGGGARGGCCSPRPLFSARGGSTAAALPGLMAVAPVPTAATSTAIATAPAAAAAAAAAALAAYTTTTSTTIANPAAAAVPLTGPGSSSTCSASSTAPMPLPTSAFVYQQGHRSPVRMGSPAPMAASGAVLVSPNFSPNFPSYDPSSNSYSSSSAPRVVQAAPLTARSPLNMPATSTTVAAATAAAPVAVAPTALVARPGARSPQPQTHSQMQHIQHTQQLQQTQQLHHAQQTGPQTPSCSPTPSSNANEASPQQHQQQEAGKPAGPDTGATTTTTTTATVLVAGRP